MNWKAIVKNVAPVIGGALGGPFGAAATKALANVLTGSEDADEAAIEQAVLSASPETLARLRESDQQFQVQMAELGFKTDQLHAHDRASAREMAQVNMWPQIILSVTFIVGYFTVLTTVHGLIKTPDEEINSQLIAFASGLLGLLTGEIPRIMAFWFGSSSGSKEKTAMAAK